MDNTSTCNECGQLRVVSATDNGSDFEAINLNFQVLDKKFDFINNKINSIFDEGGNLDLGEKCITNIGDCCGDPNSLITKDYVNKYIRAMVAQLVVDMVDDPVKFLQYSGIKFYTSTGDEVVDRF